MSQDEQTIESWAQWSKKPKIHVANRVSTTTTMRFAMVKTHVKSK
jgi:hypothetical protein